MIFKWFRGDDTLDEAAVEVYAKIVAQARHQSFYGDLFVPDTIDGRFDMLVLHAFLIFSRLKGESARIDELSQKVFDEMFLDLDHTLREMGVGDISVGKRIKKMARAFYGRAQAYEEAVMAGDREKLGQVLARNLFPDDGAPPEVIAHLSQYVLAAAAGLRAQPAEDFVAARFSFIDPRSGGDGAQQ